MTTATPINLDKLRNVVQKFGTLSFTTAQAAADYYQNDEALPGTFFEAMLHQHAALLGIHVQASTPSDPSRTIWQAI